MVRIEYLVCPLCGLNRVVRSPKRIEKGKSEVVRFDSGRLPSIQEMTILQVREGGGKKAGSSGRTGRGRAPGAGFSLVEGLTLGEIMERPEYKEILEDLKSQYIRLLADFIKIGFIKKTDVKI